MQAQSTHFSQKLPRYNQILSVLALCAVTGSLVTSIAVSAQTSESSILSLPTSSVSKSSSSSTVSNMIMSSMSQSQYSTQSSTMISRVSNQVVPIATSTFVGELDRKEGNSIFVSKDNQVKQYSVTSDIKVRRDSMESSLAMLKVGDTLTINQSQDGQKIFSIDAISKQSNDLIKWGITAAILALIIIPLLIYLLTRTKRGHIHTSTSTRK
jgi:hypothetical protein